MNRVVSVHIVAYPNFRVDPDTMEDGVGIIGMDKAAFGAFKMVVREGIGNASKFELFHTLIEGKGIESNYNETTPSQ